MASARGKQEDVLTIKASGTVSSDVRLPHLMLFDTRSTGYGWFFFEEENRFNIGVGGYIPRKRLREELERFQQESAALYGYPALGRNLRPAIWKIPVSARPAFGHLSVRRGDVEFVGVGDVLGVAHPVLGAGIEPAWQSGWLLGESYTAAKGRIDIDRYRRLLSQNLALTSRKPIDRLATRLFRGWGGPGFERIVYRFLKLAKKRTLDSFNSYPWFAPARDGWRRALLP